MGRYRLPLSMGGGEHEAAQEEYEGGPGAAEPYHEVGFDLPGVSKRIWLPVSDLVKIEPPTPPMWAVVLVTTMTAEVDPDHEATVNVGRVGMVYQHRPFRGAGAWFRAGSSRAHAWAELCTGSKPLVLTPVDRSVLRYAVSALAGSGDQGDRYCARQIADALGEWDERNQS